LSDQLKTYFHEIAVAWNRFWFTPGDPATLCLLRILAGSMLVYTHAVWSLELSTFFSPEGVFSPEYQRDIFGGSPWVWSHFYWSDSPLWLWGSHVLALLVLLAFTVGWWTRVTGILSFLIVVSYANRASGALFGLDQINGFLALYLAIAPSGAMYSLDAWRASRGQTATGRPPRDPGPFTTATIATRLIQLHLCVVYLFAGLGKLQGVTWWEGTAIWGAFASYEYQTLDMTWMVHVPWLVNVVTLVSVFWEVTYPFLVWPRLTRPVYLLIAVLLHLGIGMCMGMMTFGLIMIVANLSFVAPGLVRNTMDRLRPLAIRLAGRHAQGS
jgi:hypothetical protein